MSMAGLKANISNFLINCNLIRSNTVTIILTCKLQLYLYFFVSLNSRRYILADSLILCQLNLLEGHFCGFTNFDSK